MKTNYYVYFRFNDKCNSTNKEVVLWGTEMGFIVIHNPNKYSLPSWREGEQISLPQSFLHYIGDMEKITNVKEIKKLERRRLLLNII